MALDLLVLRAEEAEGQAEREEKPEVVKALLADAKAYRACAEWLMG
jgi:hypothetical protein